MTDTTPILDPAVLEELRELGRELEQDVLGEVVSAYRKIGPELLEKLVAAAAAQDVEGVRHAAHTLKGSSAQMGARRVCDLARELEGEARAGRSAGFAALVAACREAFAEADAALARTTEEKP